MKKVVCFIICLFLSINVYALDLSSKNVVLYNLNEDKIVYEINKDEKVSIASLTKIMTSLVALDHIDNIKDTVKIERKMISDLIAMDAYVVGLKAGEVVTYEDLLYVTMLPSGADGAEGLAYSLAGSEEEFVKWMNDKAIELGLNGLHFANAIGLDDIENYGTVEEVAELLQIALKNETFKKIFTTREYTLTNGLTVKSSMQEAANTYKLNIDYINGGKTGYTLDAGKCLASISYDTENDISYLLVTTGASIAKNNAYHILDATKIYEYYFENYKYYTLINKDDIVMTLDTLYSEDIVKVTLDKDIKYYTNEVKKELINVKYDGIDEVKAGTKIGTKLGRVSISYDGNLIDEVDVYLKDEVKFSLLEFIKMNIKIIILGIISLILLILISVKIKTKKRRMA